MSLLQSIHRPADAPEAVFETLGLHVIQDASPPDIVPDASYLPPGDAWRAVTPEHRHDADVASRRPLNNGNLSPGLQTFLEREKELSIDNTLAFRTVRRIPPTPGSPPCRLGNAYEFYRILELFTAYWLDTSLPPDVAEPLEDTPAHLRTHLRVGAGSQLPGEYRQQILSAFVKLIAYDFGCNVSVPRCESRLHVFPPTDATPSTSRPASHFSCSLNLVHRIPKDRTSARAGVGEGPVAGLSHRSATTFTTDTESRVDLGREVLAILAIAQQRAREGKEAFRFGKDKWWTQKKRWGGGTGGPIGREGAQSMDGSNHAPLADGELAQETKVPISPIRERKTMQVYDAYRRMLPPSPIWDRKIRYTALGRTPGQQEHDDIFLVSQLNHHVSIIRARVPNRLLDALDGKDAQGSWENWSIWRSRWFDLFLKDDRLAAMQLVWGMMAWMMRDTSTQNEPAKDAKEGSEHMMTE